MRAIGQGPPKSRRASDLRAYGRVAVTQAPYIDRLIVLKLLRLLGDELLRDSEQVMAEHRNLSRLSAAPFRHKVSLSP